MQAGTESLLYHRYKSKNVQKNSSTMKYFTTKHLYCVLLLIMTIGNVYAQNVNVEEVININKKKPFRINGITCKRNLF